MKTAACHLLEQKHKSPLCVGLQHGKTEDKQRYQLEDKNRVITDKRFLDASSPLVRQSVRQSLCHAFTFFTENHYSIQSSWNVRLFAFVQFIHSYHSFVHHIRHSFVTHRVHATVSVGWSVRLSAPKMGTSALRQYPRMVIDHIVCIFPFRQQWGSPTDLVRATSSWVDQFVLLHQVTVRCKTIGLIVLRVLTSVCYSSWLLHLFVM